MKICFGLLLLLLSACSTNHRVPIKNANTQSICAEQGGVWFNNQCWPAYDDDGISQEDIEKVVAKEMEMINKAQVIENGTAYPLSFFFPQEEGNLIAFLVEYKRGSKKRMMIIQAKQSHFKKDSFASSATLFDGGLNDFEGASSPKQIANGEVTINVQDQEQLALSIEGVLKSATKDYKISFDSHELLMGAGASEFEIQGSEATLNGELGTRTYWQLKNIIEKHPEIKTIVFGKINGSVNDAVNMHTGRILHEAGLNTKLLTSSEIASGGVDLFCAGKKRIVEKGAKIGIHSWCCLDELTAIEIPREHPAHKYQIAYFTMCLGQEIGPDFYFRTLEAAPFDGIHWMTDEEINKWKVATEFK